MKSILLASNFLIVWPVLQNLCEIVTRSGKELKFVENKTMEGHFHTSKIISKFHRKPFQKTFVINTSRQNLPRWFDNDDFHCYHSGEVVETCFLPRYFLALDRYV